MIPSELKWATFSIFLGIFGLLFWSCQSKDDSPVAITDPVVWKSFRISSDGLLNGLIRADEQFEVENRTVSDLLHTLLIRGKDAELQVGEEVRVRIIDVLTDCQYWDRFFDGESVLFKTKYGIQCAGATVSYKTLNQKRQSHVDQLIGVFGEIGVPPSFPIFTRQGGGSVGDVIRDSVANFSLQAEELEWTAVAYAQYLEVDSWCNKFGQKFTFGQLVGELISRYRKKTASCGGTHIVTSLVFIANSQEPKRFLTNSEADLLREFLAGCVLDAVESQNGAGGWSYGWNDPTFNIVSYDSKADFEMELLVTGHTLEWLRILPQELVPDSQVFERGAARVLQLLSVSGVLNSYDNYCQRTHALRSVRELSGLTSSSQF